MREAQKPTSVPHFCFRCDRRIEWELNAAHHGLPHGAVIFTSHGNYGSRVFDQIHGEQALLLICDECIEDAGNYIQIRKKKRQPTEYHDLGTYREWDADERARMARAAELMGKR